MTDGHVGRGVIAKDVPGNPARVGDGRQVTPVAAGGGSAIMGSRRTGSTHGKRTATQAG